MDTMNIETLHQFSFEYLLKKNQYYVEKYNENMLMKFIYGNQTSNTEMRRRLLDGIQVFSNYFQKVVALRNVFSETPKFCEVTEEHLAEELGHNLALMKDRGNRDCAWDAVLDATSAWFTWKMFVLNDEEKTVLIHLVLETSANVFFRQAHKVMSHYGETNYFKIHSEADDKHEQMGKVLLKNLSQEKYARLLEVQKQGWDMLNAMCKRIAELAIGLS